MTMTPEQSAALELNLRSMSWKALVRHLKVIVEQHHVPQELPPMIRRWLEVNRATPSTPEETAHVEREVRAIQWWVDAQGENARWFADKTETAPICGWVMTAGLVLRDGKRWWIWSAIRHDDNAPLVGPTVPAPASPQDLKKLGKIISYAGGDPKHELLRTGSITKEDRERFLAAGKPDIAEYGHMFFWWRA